MKPRLARRNLGKFVRRSLGPRSCSHVSSEKGLASPQQQTAIASLLVARHEPDPVLRRNRPSSCSRAPGRRAMDCCGSAGGPRLRAGDLSSSFLHDNAPHPCIARAFFAGGLPVQMTSAMLEKSNTADADGISMSKLLQDPGRPLLGVGSRGAGAKHRDDVHVGGRVCRGSSARGQDMLD